MYLSEPLQHATAPQANLGDEEASSSKVGHAAAEDARVLSPRSSPSKLIILFTWMSAHPNHISKYVLGYRAHYPTSRILVISISPLDLFYRRTSVLHRWVAPAISTSLSSCSASSSNPKVLLHICSNGGSYQACNFLRAFSETALRPFPPHITIFDSCPGRATFKRSVLALSCALPNFLPTRLLLLVLVYVLLSIYLVVHVPPGVPDPIQRLRLDLNDQAVIQKEKKRCYIYSETDPMVEWRDVEAHARDAARKGFVVQYEKYDGSGHCAHLRVGGGSRYWTIVNTLWQDYQN